MPASQTEHYEEVYSRDITKLRGTKSMSLLRPYTTPKNEKGAVVYFKAVKSKDKARRSSIGDNRPRDFAKGGGDFEAFKNTLTPHMDMTRLKFLLTPQVSDYGHTFDDEDEIMGNAHENSTINKECNSQMSLADDDLIYAALFADKKQASVDSGAVADFPFEGGTINEPTGVFRLSTVDRINRIFEENYAGAERKFCVISPAAKESLLANDRDKLQNAQFVTREGLLESGDITPINGITFIVDPEVTAFAGDYDDCFVAWAADAVYFNAFSPLSVKIGESADHKFVTRLYAKEVSNCLRHDDKGVVLGTLGTI